MDQKKKSKPDQKGQGVRGKFDKKTGKAFQTKGKFDKKTGKPYAQR